MALQAFEGFEGLALADVALMDGWSLTGTTSGGSLPAGRFGGLAYRQTATGLSEIGTTAGILRTVTGAQTDVYAGLAFRVETAIDPSILLGFQGNVTGLPCVIAGFRGQLQLVNFLGSSSRTVLAAGAPGQVHLGVWNSLEVRMALSGTIEIRLNGQQVLLYTASFAGSNAQIVAVGNAVVLTSGGTLADIFFPTVDDFYLLDSTSTAPYNTFLGDVRAVERRPTSDVAVAWTPSTGASNFGVVDETTQNGDTDYVSSATVAQRDRYASTTTIPGTAPTIRAVGVTWWGRKDDGVTREVRSRVRSVATDADGAAQGLGASYLRYDDVFINDPNAGAAWTKATAEASEFGPEVVT